MELLIQSASSILGIVIGWGIIYVVIQREKFFGEPKPTIDSVSKALSPVFLEIYKNHPEAYETIHGALVAEWKSKPDGNFSRGFTCKVKDKCLQDMNYQWVLNNPERVAEQEENYRISLLNGELKE